MTRWLTVPWSCLVYAGGYGTVVTGDQESPGHLVVMLVSIDSRLSFVL